MVTGSIILATALLLGETCEVVFKQSAYMAYPDRRNDAEESYMNKLATAACKTKDPDIIWSIVSTESAFRFRVIRINGTRKMLTGDKAISYLQNLKRHSNSKRISNVDIGAMQFNYYWHNATFSRDPIRMLDPSRQVAYFVKVFKPSIVRRCGQGWVGCYHNSRNHVRAKAYKTLIAQSKALLSQRAKEYQGTNLQRNTSGNYAMENN